MEKPGNAADNPRHTAGGGIGFVRQISAQYHGIEPADDADVLSVNLVIVLGGFTLLRNIFGNRHTFVWKWSIPATGVLIMISDFSYFYGVSQPDAPISMISLVRRCSCAVSFFLGAMIFRDKNIKEKSAALILLLAGAAILALAK